MFVFTRRRAYLLMITVALKVGLSIYAVWSPSFIYLISSFFALKNQVHPIPYVWLAEAAYYVWLLLPFRRVDLTSWYAGGRVFPWGPSSAALIFLWKLPVLASSLLVGWLIHARFKERASLPLFAWLLNPLVILNGEMAGNYDMIVAALVFMSVLFLNEKRYSVAAGLYAVSVALKLYPLILLPVYLSYGGGSRRRLAISGLASFSGAGLYVYWASYYARDFMVSFMLPSGNPFVFHPAEVLLTPYDSRIGLAVAFSLLYAFILHLLGFKDALKASLGVILLYSAFSDLNPTYLLCALPLMTVDSISGGRVRLYAAYTAVAFILQVFTFPLTYKGSFFFIKASWVKALSEGLNALNKEVLRGGGLGLVLTPALTAIFIALSLAYVMSMHTLQPRRLHNTR
ncbi:MAG: hypothetical protein QW172_04370 [Candidatus Bathyarchaeia archaeon]